MPIMSAGSSGLRYRAVRSSVSSLASCTRKASTSCCRRPTRSSRPAGNRRHRQRRAGDRRCPGRRPSAPAGRHWRRDRLQRRPGAQYFRQRLHADALAVRTVWAEPDVCAALRIAADRPPDRRACRNHHGWRNRFPVRAALDRIFSSAIAGAFDPFKAKDRLESMRRSAMARSFSWDLSASLYGALYRKTVGS